MNKALRKTIIAGNWKMNKTPSETTAFLNELKGKVAGADCEVIVCVPFVNLQNAVAATKGTNIKVGAENLHFEKSGAFTGEVSAYMLTTSELNMSLSATAKEDSISTKQMLP